MDKQIEKLHLDTNIYVWSILNNFILKMKRVNISTRKWAQEIPRMT